MKRNSTENKLKAFVFKRKCLRNYVSSCNAEPMSSPTSASDNTIANVDSNLCQSFTGNVENFEKEIIQEKMPASAVCTDEKETETFLGDISSCIGLKLDNYQKVERLKSLWVPPKNYTFPADQKCNRRFQRKWLDDFEWLAYSKIKNGSFCKYCVLFYDSDSVGKGSHQKLGRLVMEPCKNLKDSLEIFREHMKKQFHKTAVLNAQNIMAICEKRVDPVSVQLDTRKKQIIENNRAKLVPIVQTIRLCGRQQIPLRGHQDSGRIGLEEPNHNDGNFRALLRYRAKTDPILQQHLTESGGNALYTSPTIQNELIDCYAQIIQLKIVENIKKSGFYSILADETTDISQVEQFSLCFRYVDENTMKIKEDFLTFIPVNDLTGVGLTKTIMDTIAKFGLDIHQMRGQGYDGAASMRGQFRGVQALIMQDYPKAIYTHCVSHSLNLCLSDGAKVRDVRNAFSNISEICTFFRSSAKRTNILKTKIQELKPTCTALKLKTLCETRWVLRHEAVLLFKECLIPITAALEYIEENENSSKAHDLLQKICSYPFLVTIFVTSCVLGLTYNLSEELQSQNLDLVGAVQKVKSIVEILQSYRKRADEKFGQIYQEVKILSSDLNVEESVPRICGIKKNRANTPFNTPEEFYRRTVFIPYLDDLIAALQERFLSHEENIICLQNLLPSNISEIGPFSKIETAVKFYEDDLSGYMESIRGEWELWQLKWMSEKNKPNSAIESLALCDKKLYPNIYTMLKILAVLPVSTASVERSFSTLKRLKNYLRSTTSESRLVGLALLSIYREIVIPDDDIINRFANSGKTRRLDLVL